MNIQTATISDLLAAGISVTLDPVALKFKREGGIDVKASEEEQSIPSETFHGVVDAFTASTHSEIPKVSGSMESIQVRSPKGALLRGYFVSDLTKNDLKVVKAMKVCASEGWHLWEMQFAIYCARNGLNPSTALRPSLPNLGCNWSNDPLGYKFSFVRDAFVDYSKNMNRTLIRRLNEIK